MKRFSPLQIVVFTILALLVITPIAATLVNGYFDFLKIAAPANPPAGQGRVYVDSGTNKLACLNSDGSSCMPSGGGGGVGAQYGLWASLPACNVGNTGLLYKGTDAPLTGICNGTSYSFLGANGAGLTLIDNSTFTGVGTAPTITSNGVLNVVKAGAPTVIDWGLRVHAFPGGTFSSLTMAFSTQMNKPTIGGSLGYGMVIRESGTGKFLTFAFDIVQSGQNLFAVQHWTNTTTFNNNAFVVNADFGEFIWMRIVDSAGTRSFQLSQDGGATFYEVFSESTTVWMASGGDQYGWGLDPEPNPAGNGNITIYSLAVTP